MDLDNDGKLDLLSGSYSRSGADTMAGLFQVLKGKGENQFAAAAALQGTNGEDLVIPFQGDDSVTEAICTRPSAVDWDGDGDLDLLVGNFKGTFYFFEGQGDGKFAPKPRPVLSGAKPLALAHGDYHSDPFPVDWDGDGDLDLLSGGAKGGVQWSENTADKGSTPELSPFKILVAPTMQTKHGNLLDEKNLTGPALSTRVWADDVNGDGKLDLLVGDSVTLIAKPEGLTVEQFEEKRAKWEKKRKVLQADLRSGDEEKAKAAQSEWETFHQSSQEFTSKERTGFVWLYLQK